MKKYGFSKFQRITALILTVICLAALVTIPAAASAVMRQNVSSTAVSCNASNGSLPSGVTNVSANSSYYFNVQCDSSCYIKTADLYMKKPGQSSYSLAHTETAGGYMRYVYTKQNVGSSGGTLSYYWKLTHTNGSTTTLSASSINVASASSSGVKRQNVSSTAVSCNASNGSLPSSVVFPLAGSSYYFNVQCDSSYYVKTANLYMKKPGQSSYSLAHTETAGSYMRYVYTKQNVGSSGGVLSYYWQLKMTNGSTVSLPASSVLVVKLGGGSSSGGVNMSFDVYQQDNEPFNSLDYSYNGNGRNVGYSGCGPMALVNALRYLGRDLSTNEIKALIATCQSKQDTIRCSTGTSSGSMVACAALQNDYQFNYDKTCTVSELAKVLDGTTAVIAGVDNIDLRKYSDDGHIIAIVAYDAATGSALVLDSYQQNHSNHRYAAGQTTPFWYPIDSDPDFFSTGHVISLK